MEGNEQYNDIKRLLDNAGLQPTENDWADMESLLDKNMPVRDIPKSGKPANKPFPGKTFFSLLIGVAVVVTLLYFANTKTNQQQDLQNNKNSSADSSTTGEVNNKAQNETDTAAIINNQENDDPGSAKNNNTTAQGAPAGENSPGSSLIDDAGNNVAGHNADLQKQPGTNTDKEASGAAEHVNTGNKNLLTAQEKTGASKNNGVNAAAVSNDKLLAENKNQQEKNSTSTNERQPVNKTGANKNDVSKTTDNKNKENNGANKTIATGKPRKNDNTTLTAKSKNEEVKNKSIENASGLNGSTQKQTSQPANKTQLNKNDISKTKVSENRINQMSLKHDVDGKATDSSSNIVITPPSTEDKNIISNNSSNTANTIIPAPNDTLVNAKSTRGNVFNYSNTSEEKNKSDIKHSTAKELSGHIADSGKLDDKNISSNNTALKNAAKKNKTSVQSAKQKTAAGKKSGNGSGDDSFPGFEWGSQLSPLQFNLVSGSSNQAATLNYVPGLFGKINFSDKLNLGLDIIPFSRNGVNNSVYFRNSLDIGRGDSSLNFTRIYSSYTASLLNTFKGGFHISYRFTDNLWAEGVFGIQLPYSGKASVTDSTYNFTLFDSTFTGAGTRNISIKRSDASFANINKTTSYAGFMIWYRQNKFSIGMGYQQNLKGWFINTAPNPSSKQFQLTLRYYIR